VSSIPKNMRKKNDSRWEIEMEIPPEKVAEEVERLVSEYSRKTKVRGFRPGRAPRGMIKRMYREEIQEGVVNALVPEALDRQLEEAGIEPVGSPVIFELQFVESEPLRFKAWVDVWPEINLPEYKGIQVKKQEVTVTEEDMQKALEDLRKRAARYVPVEGRGVADGDYVVAQIQGRDARTGKALPAEKVVVLAGHHDNEEGLNQAIIGLNPGETGSFAVTYDKNHPNKRLAGREIAYQLKVEEIKEKQVPSIDDDFAREVGEYRDLEHLKDELRSQILDAKKKTRRREVAEEIVNKLAAQMNLELPESVVNRETEALFRRHVSGPSGRRISPEEEGPVKEALQEEAVRNITRHLILQKIAEKERISVSEEEIQEEMKAIAASNRVPLAKVVETVEREGRREELRDSLVRRKTVDFLVESAIIS